MVVVVEAAGDEARKDTTGRRQTRKSSGRSRRWREHRRRMELGEEVLESTTINAYPERHGGWLAAGRADSLLGRARKREPVTNQDLPGAGRARN